MGLLLIGHVHDTHPIALYLHKALGFSFIGLGVVVFLCALMHQVLPRRSTACEAMRALHALAWLLPGGLTLAMCVVLYAVDNSRGLHAELEQREVRPATTWEADMVYTAAVLLICAFHLGLLIILQPSDSGQPNGQLSDQPRVQLLDGAEEEAEYMLKPLSSGCRQKVDDDAMDDSLHQTV
mmetsp:Transcript_83367/g.166428  ORF Transcript_83367/g.166428 Transcript_83367/m.166428 type:complete len:181 (-) Transcript_83367:131-673(-)